MLLYILFSTGVLAGALITWLIFREKISRAQADAQIEMARLGERLSAGQEDARRLQRDKEELAALRDQLTLEQQRLSNQVTELSTSLEAERAKAVENLAVLNGARDELSNQFKVLANEILEDKTRRFTEQNQTNITQLLEPLKVKITEFQGQVQEV